MFINKVPRSVWPKGCFRISAWHKDDHICALLERKDEINREYSLVQGAETLNLDVIEQLVTRAIDSDDVFLVTACLEPLYDAFESFPETISVFEDRFVNASHRSKQRIACCLQYLIPNGTNRRETIGRHYSVINSDHEHFKQLWSKVQHVVERVGEKGK